MCIYKYIHIYMCVYIRVVNLHFKGSLCVFLRRVMQYKTFFLRPCCKNKTRPLYLMQQQQTAFPHVQKITSCNGKIQTYEEMLWHQPRAC